MATRPRTLELANGRWGNLLVNEDAARHNEPGVANEAAAAARAEAARAEAVRAEAARAAARAAAEEAALAANLRRKQDYSGLTVPDEHIYFYAGHGSSITHPDGTLKLETVPPNCIYITQTVCGIVNTLDTAIFQAFCNRENEEMWRDPVRNIEQINALFGPLPGVHIHYPNSTFVDTSFYPTSNNGEENGNHDIDYAGLIPLSKAHTIPSPLRPRTFKIYAPLNFKEGEIEGVSEDTVKEMYKYAVYPTKLIFHQQKTQRYIAPKSDALTLSSVGGIVPFESLIEGSRALSNSSTAADLMKRYPGIHFNFLCRSLRIGQDPGRRRQMTMRRRHSAVLQDTVFNSISKLASKGFHYAEDLGEMSNDTDVLEFMHSVEDIIRAERDMKKVYMALNGLYGVKYTRSFEYLRPIFMTNYMNQFYSLMREKRPVEEIKQFIDILQPDILYINEAMYDVEQDLLNRMATHAFNLGNASITRYTCKLGAPLTGIKNSYSQIKKFFRPTTLRQRKRILEDCRRSFTKAKTRRIHEYNYNNGRTNRSNRTNG